MLNIELSDLLIFIYYIVPITVTFDWTISEISRDGEKLNLLLTAYKKDKELELGNRPDQLEFIDFFQKAPIALHWLSGSQL